MKFQPDTAPGVNLISRHEPGRIWVAGTPYAHSLVLPWSGAVEPWEVATLAGLTAQHFERLVAFNPEVVVFGSGERLRFVAPGLQRALIERRIGCETMDTAAAARTYNVLASEGRRVLAALLIETVAGGAASQPG